MSRVIPLILALFLLCVPAAAVETDSGETLPDETVVDGDIEEEVSEPVSVTYSDTVLDDEEEVEELSQTLTDTVEALFGPYTPRTQTVTEYHSDGSIVEYQEIVPGLAGLDWPWIAASSFFGLFMFCVLKLLGGLLK